MGSNAATSSLDYASRKLPVFMRDFRSWHKPLIRLRHLLPARRGEKGNKARASRESGLLPLAPLCGERVPKAGEGPYHERRPSDWVSSLSFSASAVTPSG